MESYNTRFCVRLTPCTKHTAFNGQNLSQYYLPFCGRVTLPSGLPRWLSGKESACQRRRCRSSPNSRRKWPQTPVFLPGKPHGQRRLASHRPWGHKSVGHDLAAKQQQQHSLCEQTAFVSPFISCWISEFFPPLFTTVSHPAMNISAQVFM